MKIEYKVKEKSKVNNMEVWKNKISEKEVFLVNEGGQLLEVNLRTGDAAYTSAARILDEFEYVGVITKMEVTCQS